MATVREKIAFLRGLLEGTDLAGNWPQARVVWEKILDILDAVADRLDELELARKRLKSIWKPSMPIWGFRRGSARGRLGR